MKKSIKSIGIVAAMSILLLSAYLLGTAHSETVTEIQTVEKVVEVVPDGYIDTKADEFIDNYVDMRKVVYWEAVGGLQLYYADGSGYYWE